MFHQTHQVFQINECPEYEVRWELFKGGTFTIYYLGKEIESFIKENILSIEDAKNIAVSYIREVFKYD